MAKRGEKLDPELAARMAAARREKREERLREAAARQDVEDVSLPTGYGSSMGELEEPVSPPALSDPSDPYTIWLLTLDRETREMFSDDELRADFDVAYKKAKEEKKAKKKKELQDLALQTSRSHQGLLPAQTVEALAVARQNNRRVSMMIAMPPAQDNGAPADVGLRVDGNVIENGKLVFCTYGEACSYREQLFRHGQHELQFKGQNIRYRAYLMGQAMGSVNTQIDANERGVTR
jgi:hypothetical protein